MPRFLYKFIAFSILVGSLSLGYLWWDYKNYLNSPLSIEPDVITITVEQGSNLTRLLYQLKEQGIISKPRYLLWYARLFSKPNNLHVGEYQVTREDSPLSLIEKFLSGKVKLYSVTLIEGWNFTQMMAEINKNSFITHKLKGLNGTQIMQAIGHESVHPEGRFMPDTYHFPRGTSDVFLLKQAYTAMDDFLKQQWSGRDVGLPFKTPYDALTLASIVEKETGLASERKQIAGVFVRRLLVRMRLQTDPTVIYGMGKKFKGNIKRRDLKRNTPYNTYRNYGLPPTPIAMPSREAIDASLHPHDGETLYFVSKGDGSHYFSATLKEHNNAVIKYQLKGRKRSFSSYKKK